MFGEGAMWDDYGNNNEDKDKEETPETLVVDVDIPIVKSEPMSPTRSNSYESLQDSIMASHLPIVTPCKLKEPIILLERCDKIWETLKLIKDVQSNDLDDSTNDSAEKVDAENSTVLSSEKDLSASYIRYQPVLGNNNSALPNFQLSVKSTKKLFHCNVCGKEYRENRSLRTHSQKIHGIFIPPKRRPNSASFIYKVDAAKTELKDGKSPINNTKNYVEKNALNKELKESDGEDRTFDAKTNKNSPQIEKKNNTLAKNATHTKGGNRAKCPLCKRIVSHLHRHLTEYHKINCPNLIMKELESNVQSHTEITLKDLTKAIVNKKPLPEIIQNENIKTSKRVDENVHEETYSMPRKKFKLDKNRTSNAVNTSQNLLTPKPTKAKKLKCEICLGVYANYNSFYKHRRIHRQRGETKDNFNGLKSRYINSPLTNRRNELLPFKITNNASTVMVPNGMSKEKLKRVSLDSMESANSQDYESGIYDHNEITKITTRNKSFEILDRSCICGRSFRDYHTLVLHKKSCRFKDINETESFTEDNSDRDSGNGINITIKKKNDSYEIVSRDSGDENKSKDSGHPNDCDMPSDISDFTSEDYNDIPYKNQSVNIIESSKYSKDHSILKIETIDENIDIDIEEDSQNNSSNENEKNKQIQKRIRNKKMDEKNENNNNKGIPTLAHLCETIFTEQSKTEDTLAHLKTKETRSSNLRNTADSLKLQKKQLIKTANTSAPRKTKTKRLTDQNSSFITTMYANTTCPCGESFKTLKGCNAHIAKCHPLFLRCGYCTERFNSITEYNNHRCSVEKGKPFNKLQADMICPFCQVALKSKNEFNQHIHFQHFSLELPYQCYECTEKFPSSSGRDTHFKRVHNKCVCNVCGIKLTVALKLRHEGYHYGLGYPCHICKKAHANQHLLSTHNKKIHEEENNILVTCNICLKTLKHSSLSWHLYSHKTITTCELCKKILCDGRNLEHHIITRHKGKYPWIKCSYCKRRFCNKKLLDRHIKREKCHMYVNKISKDNALLHS